MALAASACTTALSVETTTTVADTTTSSEASTTTNVQTTTTTLAPLVPPATPDKSEIALDALVDVDGYTVTDDRTGSDLELFALFDAWLPQQIIDGAAASLVVGPDAERVAVISTIPATGLRGDPNSPAIFALSAGRSETEAVIVLEPATVTSAAPTTRCASTSSSRWTATSWPRCTRSSTSRPRAWCARRNPSSRSRACRPNPTTPSYSTPSRASPS